MKTQRLLTRIGYEGPLTPELATLAALKQAFLHTVPFENLDIHAGIPILLDPARIYSKIVEQGRGGFCYECNHVFYELLTDLGYRVDLIAARMTVRDINSPRYSHMALLVHLAEGVYLVDVGNGQSVMEPMPVPGEQISESEGISYRVDRYTDEEYALFFRTPDKDLWLPRFVFAPTPRAFEEFAPMCEFHQTSMESIFKKQRVCTLPIPGGRITLTGDTLTVDDGSSRLTVTADSPERRQELLQKYFNISMQVTELS